MVRLSQSLWVRTQDYQKAQEIINRGLSTPDLPVFAKEQLQEILNTIGDKK